MMGRQSRQMAMIFVDMESLIPENHLLRQIDRIVSFDFIYTLLAPYYPAIGRPSIDPVSMFKSKRQTNHRLVLSKGKCKNNRRVYVVP